MPEDIKPRIMPGDTFSVSYGNGSTVDVVALAGTRQRVLGRLLDELRELEKKQQIERACEIAEEAICLCMDETKAMELWDSELDIELAIEIAGSTFAKQSLTINEQKKAESPH